MSNAAISAHVSSPLRSLYVYYRVPLGQEMAAHAAIETMQATLREIQPGLLTSLMCRADEQPSEAKDAKEATWMEVYEHPAGVNDICETQLTALAQALPHGLIGPRHTEIFCPLVPSTTAHA